MGESASAIRNGGRTNGNTNTAPNNLRILFGSDCSQRPIGSPKDNANTALDTAISAVLAISSKLVVKDVRPVGDPALSVGHKVEVATDC